MLVKKKYSTGEKILIIIKYTNAPGSPGVPGQEGYAQ